MTQARKTAKKTKPAPKRGGKGVPPAKTKPAPPVGMEAFMTRQRANDGQRIELQTPEGDKSPHFLIVRGIDSDEFQKAKSKQARVIGELVALPEEEREDAALEATCKFLAVLVKDWSFSDASIMPEGAELYPCNLENVARFLREAPQIREKIDELVSRRSLFFRNHSGALTNTRNASLT